MSQATKDVPEYKPRELDEHPAVEALLRRLDFGPFRRDTVSAPVGRNDCWAGETASGTKVFVKRLVGPRSDVERRLGRVKAFERCSREMPSTALRGPRVLGFDDEAALVVFDYVEGASNGAALMVDETFDTELAAQVGTAIGQLHEQRPSGWEEFDSSPLPHPSRRLLHGLPLGMFEGLSFGEIQAWSLLQRDEELVKGVGRLRDMEEAAPRVPSHCDLRVDQFLVLDGPDGPDGPEPAAREVLVTDWEEFRLADPARDVGGFAGEWLYRSVLDIVTTRGDSDFMDVELTHELVLERGAQKLERLLPLIRAFWAAYRAERSEVDRGSGGLAERATAFAGWHTLDRLMAASQRTAKLSGIERAAAGIGRGALINPAKFSAALGLEETI